jgi:hypothetical protein
VDAAVDDELHQAKPSPHEKGLQQPRVAASFSQVIPACSIEEGHVLHRLRLPLGVHHDPMPAVQGDRRMVGMTDATPDVDTRIAPQLEKAFGHALLARVSDRPTARIALIRRPRRRAWTIPGERMEQ